MAFGHGTQISLTLGGVDITDYISSVSPEFTRAMAEMRHLGATRVARLPGFQDFRCTIEGDFEPALDTALWSAFNGSTEVILVYGPQGAGTGSPRFSIPVFCTRYSPGPAGDEAVKASAELVGSGSAITKDTF